MKRVGYTGIFLGILALIGVYIYSHEAEGMKDCQAVSLQGYHMENLSKELKREDLLEETYPSGFTYEELSDGTLRIINYDSDENTQNPYQVTIPSEIDGKKVSTLGKECLGSSLYTGKMVELTVSEGITTIEANIVENTMDIYLVKLPDSVTDIDEKAFYRNGYQESLAIACSDTSYAYQYAKENDFACQIAEPVLPENDFLAKYQEGTETKLPYFAHFREERENFDYVTIEYRDTEMDRRLRGEFVYGSSPNEFLALVLDKNTGNVLQCLDSSCANTEFAYLSAVYCQDFLSFRDWNFDGYEDITCYQGIFGTGAATYSSLFVYDVQSGLYKNVDEFSHIDSPSLKEDKQCIYGFSRGSAVTHYVDRYEYVDGVLTKVARLSQLGGIENDGMEIIDERLVDGKWQVYHQEKFYPRDMSVKEPWQDAYEQSKVLYVGDGYWDL